MNKKADGNIVWIVVVLGLLLVFAVVYFSGWKNMFGKGTKVIDNQISDSDNDGILDINDKCKTVYGTIEYSGCPNDENG